ncbi:hypothetical protein CD32_14325 [Lysinibacillus odysseyi 34hs-1 = NBRC 100172]|uniref:Uncharacterized protein n=1 Tax=Lysinibacillus odysseyi 34hs-1 = NBRC 100172 TaxID=1220589 RepID=A0A0A3IK93_9BACI|nr:hypothetical protein CD32_14325 [Lysinibacillus odysseyi 34hs-1 = NBRC 100172]
MPLFLLLAEHIAMNFQPLPFRKTELRLGIVPYSRKARGEAMQYMPRHCFITFSARPFIA